MKQNFEQIVRESLNNQELPYEAGAWEKFQASTVAPTPFYKSMWFVASIVGLIVIGSIVVTNTSNSELNNKELIVSNDIEVTNIITSTKNETTLSENSNLNVVNTEINSVETTANIEDNSPKTGLTDNSLRTEPNNLPEKAKSKELGSQIGNGDNNKIKPLTPITNPNEPVTVISTEMASARFFVKNEICQGSKIYLVSEENNPNHNYVWTVNRTKILKGASSEYVAKDAGENEIILAIFDKNGKQLASKSSQITVNQAPLSDITINRNKSSLVNEFEIVNNDSYSAMTINYGDGTSSTEDYTHTYKGQGIYQCNISLTSEEGCVTTIKEKIELEGYYNFQKDFGFSPFDDNNLNDYFIPQILKTINVPFKMVIYSRNGEPVYTTTSVDQPWDGRLANGKQSSFESFVWVVTLTNEFGVKETYKGTVTNVNN
jgi:hypothetical protein